MGPSSELKCFIGDIECKGMIDTGSQVSTLSLNFFNKHFPKEQLRSIGDFLRLEHVGGGEVPYAGYFEISISLPINSDTLFTTTVPVLVVFDTKYNLEVPLLIGTNFLKLVTTDFSIPMESCTKVKAAVQAVRCFHNFLNEHEGLLSEITVDSDIEIPALTGRVLRCTARIDTPIHTPVTAIVESSKTGEDNYSIVPNLIAVTNQEIQVPVEIYNDQNVNVVVGKGTKIAELHHAQIQAFDKETTESNEYSDFLNQFDFSDQPVGEVDKIKQFLVSHRNTFAMNFAEMGCTNVVQHTIDFNVDKIIVDKPRPIPPGCYDELRQHLDELLDAGIIEPSHSPYCHNMVFVRKKDGSLRLVQDFRSTNLNCSLDKYSVCIPHIDTLLESLGGAKYFATLDLFAGYHQIAMHPAHVERTAFTAGSLGFYHYIRMPMGLSGAPSTFQRCMDTVLKGLTMKICCVYLDDVVVFAETREQLYGRLETVFDRLDQANLKLKPKKCKLFQTSIEFLGHTVSEQGIECNKNHVEAVLSWPRPVNIKTLQSLLGFLNFYRKFIPGFSTIAAPLTKLLKGHCHKKSKHKSKRNHVHSIPEPWNWGEPQDLAFETLKKLITTAPILKFPEWEKQFFLHTDASAKGLGAVIYQKDNLGKLRPVAYGSKSLSMSERKYSAHKLEFLALKWAVTVKFKYYLYGRKFQIYTDHNPLVYLTKTAKLDALGHRWLADLSSYQFDIFYKPGRLNQDADGLSRRSHPEEEMDECRNTIKTEVFEELCRLLITGEFAGVAESLGVLPEAMNVHALYTHEGKTSIDWVIEQSKDPDISRVIEVLNEGKRPSEKERRAETPGVMRLLSHWEAFTIIKGVLYKRSQYNDHMVLRLVVPHQQQDKVLSMVHDELGHLGRDKTLSVSQERFFWIGLTKSVDNKVRHCPRCICSKSPYIPDRAPLHSIVTSRPLELVCMDFLGLEQSKGGQKYVLVVTDHYTKYALAYSTKNQEAKTVAKILADDFILHYGIPERLHSDMGGSFEGKVIHHLCELLGIAKSKTTPYHPMGNGETERFNRSLISMLKTLETDEKIRWKDHLSSLVHAYNCTRHDSTGYSPFFLMFGRQPRLPVDIFLGLPGADNVGQEVRSVQESLELAYKTASQATRQAANRQKKHYDKKTKGTKIQVGDIVLIRNVGLVGKCKLADRWQREKYVVIEHPNSEIPVYKVQLETGGKVKVLHRNMLLPLQLPSSFPSSRKIIKRPKVLRKDDNKQVVREESTEFHSEQASNSEHSDNETSELDYEITRIVTRSTAKNIVQKNNTNDVTSFQQESEPSTPVSQDPFEEGENVNDELEDTVGNLSSPKATSTPLLEPQQEKTQQEILEPVPMEELEDGEMDEDLLPRRSSRKGSQRQVFQAGFSQLKGELKVPEWKEKITVLLQCYEVFPSQGNLIGQTICQIIAASML